MGDLYAPPCICVIRDENCGSAVMSTITYTQCLYFTVDKSVVWSDVGRLSRTVTRLQDSHSRSRWPQVWVCGRSLAVSAGFGYLLLVNVVSFQVEISATDRSLIQTNPTVCMCVGVIECDQVQ